MNKIVTLFDHRQFDQIISILIPTFTNVIKEDRLDSAPGGADRPLQIVMLLDCFWHKNNFEVINLDLENSTYIFKSSKTFKLILEKSFKFLGICKYQ